MDAAGKAVAEELALVTGNPEVVFDVTGCFLQIERLEVIA